MSVVPREAPGDGAPPRAMRKTKETSMDAGYAEIAE